MFRIHRSEMRKKALLWSVGFHIFLIATSVYVFTVMGSKNYKTPSSLNDLSASVMDANTNENYSDSLPPKLQRSVSSVAIPVQKIILEVPGWQLDCPLQISPAIKISGKAVFKVKISDQGEVVAIQNQSSSFPQSVNERFEQSIFAQLTHCLSVSKEAALELVSAGTITFIYEPSTADL